MDGLLFNPDKLRSHCGPGGRVLLFMFCRAAIIFVSRFMEVSGDRDASNIIVVSLPFGDTISRAGGRDEIAAYAQLHGKQVCVPLVRSGRPCHSLVV